jgi:serine/threonine-protein kinase
LHGFGHGGDDRPADVYALGIIAYELLTGHLPFEGGTPEEVLEMQMMQTPVPPSVSRPELPEIFDEVVLAAMAKDPEQRPSATQFAENFAAARAAAARGYATVRETFVVVDDDPAFRRWAEAALLAAYPKANVQLCHTGAAALQVLGRTRVRALVSDLDMPKMNGMELTNTVRERYPKVPIVVATGVGGAGDWKILRGLGADEIVLKPMRMAALSAAVTRAIRAVERGEDELSPGLTEATA